MKQVYKYETMKTTVTIYKIKYQNGICVLLCKEAMLKL